VGELGRETIKKRYEINPRGEKLVFFVARILGEYEGGGSANGESLKRKELREETAAEEKGSKRQDNHYLNVREVGERRRQKKKLRD